MPPSSPKLTPTPGTARVPSTRFANGLWTDWSVAKACSCVVPDGRYWPSILPTRPSISLLIASPRMRGPKIVAAELTAASAVARRRSGRSGDSSRKSRTSVRRGLCTRVEVAIIPGPGPPPIGAPASGPLTRRPPGPAGSRRSRGRSRNPPSAPHGSPGRRPGPRRGPRPGRRERSCSSAGRR